MIIQKLTNGSHFGEGCDILSQLMSNSVDEPFTFICFHSFVFLSNNFKAFGCNALPKFLSP